MTSLLWRWLTNPTYLMKLLFCVGLVLLAPGLYAQTMPAATVPAGPAAPLTLAECRALALTQNQRLTAADRRRSA
jgi:outer membrane protein